MTENNHLTETANTAEAPETKPFFARPAVHKTLLVAGAAAGLFFAGAALARKNAQLNADRDEIVVAEVPDVAIIES